MHYDGVWGSAGMTSTKHVVLERLNKLVARGYVVRWGKSEQDTLRREHPRAPDLTLLSDGSVWVLTVSPDDWVGAEKQLDQNRFQSFTSPNDWIAAENKDDQRRFRSFLARVPKPTPLQRFKAITIEDIWIRSVVWTVVIVLSVAVTFFVSWGWRQLAGE